MDKTTNDGEAIGTAEHTAAHSPQIKPYTKLTPEQVAAVDQLKALEQLVADALNALQHDGLALTETERAATADDGAAAWQQGLRDINTARDQMRTGFIYAVRSIARPNGGI